MKKGFLSLICLSMLIAFSFRVSVFAEEPTVSVETNNINYVFSEEELINTEYEGKNVYISDGEVYVNGTYSSTSIACYVAGVLIGYFIDGVIIYVSGYSGAELTATAINSIVDAINSIAETLKSAYFKSTSSKVTKVKTTGGSDCVRHADSLYACTMSFEE